MTILSDPTLTDLKDQGLTGQEIAEAIWLATHTDGGSPPAIDVAREGVEDTEATIEPDNAPPADIQAPPPRDPQAEIVPAPVKQTPSLALPRNYTPIPVPDAPALSQALQLARSLRPLARQVAVGLPALIDEDATVEHIAETGVWQPVLRPASELWLDVALVFDASPSMCLWQRFGQDLHRLLSRYGEFRDVRVWQLKQGDGRVELTARNGTVHQPRELLTGDRRRLVVIVSDCVSRAWYDGTMHDLVKVWSDHLPTVVFQVFPERLWSRTALARSVTVEFRRKREGLLNRALHPIPRSVWQRERLANSLPTSPVRLPVVTPDDPESLADWASMIAGNRRVSPLGIVWDAPATAPPSSQQRAKPTAALIQDRVDSFLLTASPISKELAALLASAPVITLPIVRLIKQSNLRQASAVHIAEVFMSGLLQVSGADTPDFENAERIIYELVDDQVRDRLRAGSLVADALTVYRKVSDYVAKGLQRSVDEFWALLRTPSQAATEDDDLPEFLEAFATVTGDILRGLGGEFEAIADALAPLPAPAETTAEDTDVFPTLRTLEFMKAEVVDLEEDTDAEAEIPEAPGLESFDFEMATVIRRQQEWVIERQPRSADRFIEVLGSDSVPLQLEMVAIPGGIFTMGSPDNEPSHSSDESPQHEVSIQPFFMGRYPVTQAQWRFVAGLEPVDRQLEPDPSRFKRDLRPVERVSWYDAVEFCQRLSRHTERAYRLPSEAEWEYACRAGTTTPFHFGETITPEVANYDGNYTYNNGSKGDYRRETTPVDHFGIANAWGLCDMHGNILEWCQDHWHDSYEVAPGDGSAWLTDNEDALRVSRGGSWNSYPRYCRSAFRSDINPRGSNNYIGFRVVCVAPRTLQDETR